MPPRPCVLDASLLLSLGKAGHLHILGLTTTFGWHLAPIARTELRTAETRGPVERLIVEGVIAPVELDSDDTDSMALFAEWSERVDAGEAETIAIALAKEWLVALEDRAAQRQLDRRVGAGHWINCANILLSAVREEELRIGEADEIFRRLDVYPGYVSRGVRGLGDLL